MSKRRVVKPMNAHVVPDMFGFHLHYDGNRFFLPNDQLHTMLIELAYWLQRDRSEDRECLAKIAEMMGVSVSEPEHENQVG